MQATHAELCKEAAGFGAGMAAKVGPAIAGAAGKMKGMLGGAKPQMLDAERLAALTAGRSVVRPFPKPVTPPAGGPLPRPPKPGSVVNTPPTGSEVQPTGGALPRPPKPGPVINTPPTGASQFATPTALPGPGPKQTITPDLYMRGNPAPVPSMAGQGPKPASPPPKLPFGQGAALGAGTGVGVAGMGIGMGGLAGGDQEPPAAPAGPDVAPPAPTDPAGAALPPPAAPPPPAGNDVSSLVGAELPDEVKAKATAGITPPTGAGPGIANPAAPAPNPAAGSAPEAAWGGIPDAYKSFMGGGDLKTVFSNLTSGGIAGTGIAAIGGGMLLMLLLSKLFGKSASYTPRQTKQAQDLLGRMSEPQKCALLGEGLAKQARDNNLSLYAAAAPKPAVRKPRRPMVQAEPDPGLNVLQTIARKGREKAETKRKLQYKSIKVAQQPVAEDPRSTLEALARQRGVAPEDMQTLFSGGKVYIGGKAKADAARAEMEAMKANPPNLAEMAARYRNDLGGNTETVPTNSQGAGQMPKPPQQPSPPAAGLQQAASDNAYNIVEQSRPSVKLGPAATGLIGMLGAGALGAGIGGTAGAAAGLARGNTPEGFGRGVVRGGATGVGAAAGSMLGNNLGRLAGAPGIGEMLGALGGGAAGYYGSGKLLGDPVGNGDNKAWAVRDQWRESVDRDLGEQEMLAEQAAKAAAFGRAQAKLAMNVTSPVQRTQSTKAPKTYKFTPRHQLQGGVSKAVKQKV